jgi:phage/plasmid primase-like uncharacterized protein
MSERKGRYDVQALRTACEGRWREIFSALISNTIFHAAMDANGRKHGPCPVHGGKTKFRLFPNWEQKGGGISNDEDPKALTNGINMIMWVNNQDFLTVCKNIEAYLGGTYRDEEMSPQQKAALAKRAKEIEERRRAEQAEEDQRNRDRLNKVWRASLDNNSPEALPLRKYLVSRGLDAFGLPETMRFHPALPYLEDEETYLGTFPGIISLVTDVDGNPVTLHRTYLTEDGRKAPVSEGKKVMGYVKLERDMRGTGIRMGKIGRILHVAEGLETILSVMASINETSAISAINSGNMASLVVPPQVEIVVIWADHDRPNPRTGVAAGIHAAEELHKVLKSIGIKTFIMLPNRDIPEGAKSVDWNDILVKEGPRVIRREYERIRQNF